MIGNAFDPRSKGPGLGSKQKNKEHAEQRWRSAGVNMVGVDYCK